MKIFASIWLPDLAASTWAAPWAQAAESAIPLPDEDKAAIEQFLGKGVVGEPIPAPEAADTGRYLAARPGTRTFRMVSGPDASKTERQILTQLRQTGGETTWKYDAGGKIIAYVTGKPNGDYVLTGVTDTEAAATTRYSPPEPFML